MNKLKIKCSSNFIKGKIFGYVPQSIYLFDDNIKNNILIGRQLEIKDEEYSAAVKLKQDHQITFQGSTVLSIRESGVADISYLNEFYDEGNEFIINKKTNLDNNQKYGQIENKIIKIL